MRKYYTRPCNFHYGNNARNLVKINKEYDAINTEIDTAKEDIFKVIEELSSIKQNKEEIRNLMTRAVVVLYFCLGEIIKNKLWI